MLAGSLPQTPLGELTALSQTLQLDLKDLLLVEENEGEGRKEDGRVRERRGDRRSGKGREEGHGNGGGTAGHLPSRNLGCAHEHNQHFSI